MAMFLGHIAFILEIFALATGLTIIRSSKKDISSFAGWILIVVGILGVICTGYYMVHYALQGDFIHAYPQMMMGH